MYWERNNIATVNSDTNVVLQLLMTVLAIRLAITSFVDLVFGAGFASLSTAINKVIDEKHPKNAIGYAVVG